MRVFVGVALFAVLITQALCGTIYWSGHAGDNLWSSPDNWNTHTVPGVNDDVIVNSDGGSSIKVISSATCNSVTIGGGQYFQALTILAAFAAGQGGISVQTLGTVIVSAPSNAPVTYAGPFDIRYPDGLNFTSGTLSGPGVATVHSAGTANFLTAAQKTVSRGAFNINGKAFIQGPASTLAVESKGSINVSPNGLLQINGNVLVLSNDKSGMITSAGTINYACSNGQDQLMLQAAAAIGGTTTVSCGSYTIMSNYFNNGTVMVSTGASLAVRATPSNTINFNGAVGGNGAFSIFGSAVTFNGKVNIANFYLNPGSQANINGNTAVANFGSQGSLNVSPSGGFSAQTTNIGSGSGFIGTGAAILAGTITFSTSGGTVVVGSPSLSIQGTATIADTTTLLLNGNGMITFTAQSKTTIAETVNFALQNGSPSIKVDGTFDASKMTGSFSTNVPFTGNGKFMIGNTFGVSGVGFSCNEMDVSNNAFVSFQGSRFSINTITGSGNFSVSTTVNPGSSAGQVAASGFTLSGGQFNVDTLEVTDLTLENGQLTTGGGGAAATTFNFQGGTLAGSTLSAGTAIFTGQDTKTLSEVLLKSNALFFSCSSQCTYIMQNNAEIQTGSGF